MSSSRRSFLDEPRVAGDDDAQQRLGIETGTGQQAQLREHLRRHFLRFVDEQNRSATAGFEMAEPALAQRFEAAPTIGGFQRHRKDVAQLAIEIGQIALRVVDRADGDVGEFFEPFGKQAQDDALAAARIAVDHGEAALANLCVLDAPTEVLDLRRHIDRVDRQFRREGIPFEPIEGE